MLIYSNAIGNTITSCVLRHAMSLCLSCDLRDTFGPEGTSGVYHSFLVHHECFI